MGAGQDQCPQQSRLKGRCQPYRPNFTDGDTELRGAERFAQEMLLSHSGGGGRSGQKDGTVHTITCTLGSCSRFPAFALRSWG